MIDNCKGCKDSKNVKCLVCGSVMTCLNDKISLVEFRDIVQGVKGCEARAMKTCIDKFLKDKRE